VNPRNLAAACDRVLIYKGDGAMDESDSATPDQLIEQIYGTEHVALGGTSTGQGSTV